MGAMCLLMLTIASPPPNDPLPELHWLPPVQTYASPYNLARILARLCPPAPKGLGMGCESGPIDEFTKLRIACIATKKIRAGMKDDEWRPFVRGLNLHSFAGSMGFLLAYDYLWVFDTVDWGISNCGLSWP